MPPFFFKCKTKDNKTILTLYKLFFSVFQYILCIEIYILADQKLCEHSLHTLRAGRTLLCIIFIIHVHNLYFSWHIISLMKANIGSILQPANSRCCEH